MAMYGIRLKIDVTKIIRDWIFEGKKGKYVDATLWLDSKDTDDYGNNGSIKHDRPKGLREAEKNLPKEQHTIEPFIGSASIFFHKSSEEDPQEPEPQQAPYEARAVEQPTQQPQTPFQDPPKDEDPIDDIPF